MTKLGLLREGVGCWTCWTRLVGQCNKSLQACFQVLYCCADVRACLSQIANHGVFAGKRRLVRTGQGERIIQGNCEKDHYEKAIRRLHCEISYIPQLVK